MRINGSSILSILGVLSRRGRVNSGMAGGDLDGDLNFVSFSIPLVALAQLTEPHVRAVDMASIEAKIVQDAASHDAGGSNIHFDIQQLWCKVGEHNTALQQGSQCLSIKGSITFHF